MSGSREPDTRPILVTGSTGTIGKQVVRDLLAAGRRVRAADISTERVRQEFGDHVDPAVLDFTNPTTWYDAYKDIDAMFLMRPPQLSNIQRDMAPSLQAAKGAGLKHTVLLSLQGAETNQIVPHARIEAWLRESGLRWTFVRPSFFMENLSTTHAADLRDRGEIIVPAGTGATSFVAAADVAAVAAAALLDPGEHINKAWTPTGTVAMTYAEVADVLSEVLDREIRYTKPGALSYMRHAKSEMGMEAGMVLVTTAIYSIARFGKAAGVTDDVRAVTGRAPIDFRDWAIEHRDAWA
jgi:uncharacterized protein YbjT (DUF2867 family)